MDPRGTFGRVYKEELYTLLYTKYEIISLWELLTPWGGEIFDHRGMISQDLCNNAAYII